jgi:hypothetical protein
MPTYRRLASLSALAIAVLLVAACATSPAPTPTSPSAPAPASPTGPAGSPGEPTPSEVVDGVSVTVETIGGHCIQGACDSTITIEPDGRAHQVKPEPKELGTVPLEIMQALVVEVQQADFDAIRSQPFTDTCPIAFDGQQFVYTFSIASHSEQIDSCQVVVDPENPLFVAVDAAITSVTPS